MSLLLGRTSEERIRLASTASDYLYAGHRASAARSIGSAQRKSEWEREKKYIQNFRMCSLSCVRVRHRRERMFSLSLSVSAPLLYSFASFDILSQRVYTVMQLLLLLRLPRLPPCRRPHSRIRERGTPPKQPWVSALFQKRQNWFARGYNMGASAAAYRTFHGWHFCIRHIHKYWVNHRLKVTWVWNCVACGWSVWARREILVRDKVF